MRLHHGHSAATGFVLALALQRHALTFALLIFAGGFAFGLTWAFWKRSTHALGKLGLTYGVRILNRLAR